MEFFRSHENLRKAEPPIVTKGILPYSSLKPTVLLGKPCPFKICLNKPVLRKKLASCVLPGTPTVPTQTLIIPNQPRV